MGVEARKISFDEAWNTMTVFFFDERLEDEIDGEVEGLLAIAKDRRLSNDADISVDSLFSFLSDNQRGLDVILRDIGLSDEKFMRIISLLRRLGRIPGNFESEWTISQLKQRMRNNQSLTMQIARLLFEGAADETLKEYIPRYYLERLNYGVIGGSSLEARRVRYKHALIGKYSGRKGYYVEKRVSDALHTIQNRYPFGIEQGRSQIVETDIVFALPSLADPLVIIMCSFQETTSSGQSTKAREMFAAYERVQRNIIRYGENRAFVNFVDGDGWLARKRDLERLVENCHYFLNFSHLDLLEAIIHKHILNK